MHIASITYFISNLAMMEFVLTEIKKTKLQSDFSLSTIIQFEPLHHRFVCIIIDNICNINSKSSQMVIPVSIFIIYVNLDLLIELIMNKKIKNKTGITITPLFNRSLQISEIYLDRTFLLKDHSQIGFLQLLKITSVSLV